MSIVNIDGPPQGYTNKSFTAEMFITFVEPFLMLPYHLNISEANVNIRQLVSHEQELQYPARMDNLLSFLFASYFSCIAIINMTS